MQDDSADDLYIEVLHPQASPGAFTAYCKSLRQDVVQAFASRDPFLELFCFGTEFRFGEGLHLGLVRHNFVRYL